jgi:N-acetyltransferase 10
VQELGLNVPVTPRNNLPPLLLKLSERPPERLHYLGVSYGLTQPLHKYGTGVRRRVV